MFLKMPKIVVLLLLALSFSAIAPAFHYHDAEEAEEHLSETCSFCVLANQKEDDFVWTDSFSLTVHFMEYELSDFQSNQNSFKPLLTHHSRAPPLV